MKQKTRLNSRFPRVKTFFVHIENLTRSQWAYGGQIALLLLAAIMIVVIFATSNLIALAAMLVAVVAAFVLEGYRD
jgi:hypothetical protein